VRLLAARPNPFSARTSLRFALDEPGTARLTVHDVTGRRVRTLDAGFRGAGEHEIIWDGRNENGVPVSAGVYLYRLQVGESFDVRRVVRLD
jgi:flagellar hook assembly protein FlgD